MAIIFMDGFDLYSDTVDLYNTGWYRESATSNFLRVGEGKYGGNAIESVTAANGWQRPLPKTVAPGTTLFVSFWYWHDGLGGAANNILLLRTTHGITLATFTHNAAGAITPTGHSGSALSATPNALTVNDWTWVEFRITLGTNDTNGAMQIRADGAVVGNYTGVDTFNASQHVAAIILSGSQGVHYIDDVVIHDDTGLDNTDYLGPCVIETLRPNNDTALSEWSLSTGSLAWALVEDNNDDTDYVSTSTDGDAVRFAMDNLADAPDSIFAIQVRYKVRKTDAGTRKVRGIISSGGVPDEGAAEGVVLSYAWNQGDVFERNPDGAVVWTFSAINGLEAGVELVS